MVHSGCRKDEGWQDAERRRSFILENTRVVAPPLCPEIPLRLVTSSCPLWRATEEDLAALGIGEPYWGFCWAGGQALARYVLDHPDLVCGRRVFVFGAGCGIEALAALKAGATHVLASDIDPFAVDSLRLNAELNGVQVDTTLSNMLGKPLEGFPVVLSGDMFHDPAFAREVLTWLTVLAAEGGDILIGDPGRGNLGGASVRRLATYRAPSDVDVDGKYLQEAGVYAVTGP